MLSFPIDGRDAAAGRASRARSATSCSAPHVVGDDWRWPLVHGLLHLLGYDHGAAMEARERVQLPVIAPRRSRPSILDSFNYAFEGIIHVLRTQRNMRIHFVVAAVVLVAALGSDVTRLELIALLLAIAFVLIAEMVNTAIEGADRRRLDVVRPDGEAREGHRRRRRADRGASTRSPSATSSSPVRSPTSSSRLLDRLSDAPAELTLVALVLTISLVIAMKAFGGRGTPLRGGLPSGHAAVAFAAWMAVDARAAGTPTTASSISSLTLIMALLVAQTRIESGVHSALEVRVRRAARRARHARDLPGVLGMTRRGAARRRRRRRRACLRAVLGLPRRLRRAVSRRSRGRGRSTSRTPRTRSASAPSARPSRVAIAEGYRPGDFAVAAITASPCGGCRQWLAEMKVERVVFRNGGRVVDDDRRTSSCRNSSSCERGAVSARGARRRPPLGGGAIGTRRRRSHGTAFVRISSIGWDRGEEVGGPRNGRSAEWTWPAGTRPGPACIREPRPDEQRL